MEGLFLDPLLSKRSKLSLRRKYVFREHSRSSYEEEEEMKIYTILPCGGIISSGAEVITYETSEGNYPIIAVGEKGRGRQFAFVPATLRQSLDKWKEEGTTTIYQATLGQTHRGLPRLEETEHDQQEEEVIVVIRLGIGFRGGNEITGDDDGKEGEYLPFPASRILAEGVIAQGIAGRMGSGTQLIATVPVGAVFRTRRSGRLYGDEPVYYYKVSKDRIVSATPQQRDNFNIF